MSAISDVKLQDLYPVLGSEESSTCQGVALKSKSG